LEVFEDKEGVRENEEKERSVESRRREMKEIEKGRA
jgi:hypothetical protein